MLDVRRAATPTSRSRSPASTRIAAPTASREAKRLVAAGQVRGLKLHPPIQEFFPNDRLAYPLYEVFAEARLPVLFHTGHSGIGTGMRGGGGIRLKYGHPMPIDDVAVDFPDMPIVMAHPSFPWQDEAISVCLHKPQVYIDLSGLVAEVLLADADPVRQHAAEAQGAVRVRLPAADAGPLDGRLREDRDQGRGAAAHPEGERHAIAGPRLIESRRSTVASSRASDRHVTR